jgi:hypothetical protein
MTMPSRTLPTTATEIHEHLQALRLERALAGVESRAVDPDLEDEIDATRTAYVGAAVTEIAGLRGDLSGRPSG